MSLQQQARQLIDQAEAAIRADNAQYALELLRQSILYNGKDADAYILLGIALAQTKMPADAENAFKKAVRLAPDSVKARYNLAVHQYTEGQVRAALETARKAYEIDTLHAGSKNLVSKIEAELGLQPGEQPKTTAAGNPMPAQFHEGYEETTVQTMPFVERLGPAWIVIAWIISVASVTGLLLTLSMARPYLGQNVDSEGLVKAMSTDPRFHLAQILFFGSILLGIVWTGMDAINRRGNLLWLLPQVFCGCLGFTWLILPAYIFFARKSEETKPA
ncbi:MAG TPA: tetratricopeptide repeat protein [Fimbriimonadaceae bacterium]|nr:tetratricopeptide repeat protein [Fimbriimonadaceae bacterium]